MNVEAGIMAGARDWMCAGSYTNYPPCPPQQCTGSANYSFDTGHDIPSGDVFSFSPSLLTACHHRTPFHTDPYQHMPAMNFMASPSLPTLPSLESPTNGPFGSPVSASGSFLSRTWNNQSQEEGRNFQYGFSFDKISTDHFRASHMQRTFDHSSTSMFSRYHDDIQLQSYPFSRRSSINLPPSYMNCVETRNMQSSDIQCTSQYLNNYHQGQVSYFDKTNYQRVQDHTSTERSVDKLTSITGSFAERSYDHFISPRRTSASTEGDLSIINELNGYYYKEAMLLADRLVDTRRHQNHAVVHTGAPIRETQTLGSSSYGRQSGAAQVMSPRDVGSDMCAQKSCTSKLVSPLPVINDMNSSKTPALITSSYSTIPASPNPFREDCSCSSADTCIEQPSLSAVIMPDEEIVNLTSGVKVVNPSIVESQETLCPKAATDESMLNSHSAASEKLSSSTSAVSSNKNHSLAQPETQWSTGEVSTCPNFSVGYQDALKSPTPSNNDKSHSSSGAPLACHESPLNALLATDLNSVADPVPGCSDQSNSFPDKDKTHQESDLGNNCGYSVSAHDYSENHQTEQATDHSIARSVSQKSFHSPVCNLSPHHRLVASSAKESTAVISDTVDLQIFTECESALHNATSHDTCPTLPVSGVNTPQKLVSANIPPVLPNRCSSSNRANSELLSLMMKQSNNRTTSSPRKDVRSNQVGWSRFLSQHVQRSAKTYAASELMSLLVKQPTNHAANVTRNETRANNICWSRFLPAHMQRTVTMSQLSQFSYAPRRNESHYSSASGHTRQMKMHDFLAAKKTAPFIRPFVGCKPAVPSRSVVIDLTEDDDDEMADASQPLTCEVVFSRLRKASGIIRPSYRRPPFRRSSLADGSCCDVRRRSVKGTERFAVDRSLSFYRCFVEYLLKQYKFSSTGLPMRIISEVMGIAQPTVIAAKVSDEPQKLASGCISPGPKSKDVQKLSGTECCQKLKHSRRDSSHSSSDGDDSQLLTSVGTEETEHEGGELAPDVDSSSVSAASNASDLCVLPVTQNVEPDSDDECTVVTPPTNECLTDSASIMTGQACCLPSVQVLPNGLTKFPTHGMVSLLKLSHLAKKDAANAKTDSQQPDKCVGRDDLNIMHCSAQPESSQQIICTLQSDAKTECGQHNDDKNVSESKRESKNDVILSCVRPLVIPVERLDDKRIEELKRQLSSSAAVNGKPLPCPRIVIRLPAALKTGQSEVAARLDGAKQAQSMPAEVNTGQSEVDAEPDDTKQAQSMFSGLECKSTDKQADFGPPTTRMVLRRKSAIREESVPSDPDVKLTTNDLTTDIPLQAHMKLRSTHTVSVSGGSEECNETSSLIPPSIAPDASKDFKQASSLIPPNTETTDHAPPPPPQEALPHIVLNIIRHSRKRKARWACTPAYGDVFGCKKSKRVKRCLFQPRKNIPVKDSSQEMASCDDVGNNSPAASPASSASSATVGYLTPNPYDSAVESLDVPDEPLELTVLTRNAVEEALFGCFRSPSAIKQELESHVNVNGNKLATNNGAEDTFVSLQSSIDDGVVSGCDSDASQDTVAYDDTCDLIDFTKLESLANSSMEATYPSNCSNTIDMVVNSGTDQKVALNVNALCGHQLDSKHCGSVCSKNTVDEYPLGQTHSSRDNSSCTLSSVPAASSLPETSLVAINSSLQGFDWLPGDMDSDDDEADDLELPEGFSSGSTIENTRCDNQHSISAATHHELDGVSDKLIYSSGNSDSGVWHSASRTTQFDDWSATEFCESIPCHSDNNLHSIPVSSMDIDYGLNSSYLSTHFSAQADTFTPSVSQYPTESSYVCGTQHSYSSGWQMWDCESNSVKFRTSSSDFYQQPPVMYMPQSEVLSSDSVKTSANEDDMDAENQMGLWIAASVGIE